MTNGNTTKGMFLWLFCAVYRQIMSFQIAVTVKTSQFGIYHAIWNTILDTALNPLNAIG